jgi:anthranilate/para-aminobenzoate synthase component I
MQQIDDLDARAILARHDLMKHPEFDAPAGAVVRLLDILAGTTALPGAREGNVFLGGRGSPALFGLARREIPFDQLLAMPLDGGSPSASITDAACGLAGLLAYDDLELTVYQDQDWVRDNFTPRLSRCFAIQSGLAFDNARKSVVLVSAPGEGRAAMERLEERLDIARNHIEIMGNPEWETWQAACVPDTSDEEYLERAGSVIAAIRDGRYYQLNLLRYFKIPGTPPPGWLERRIERVGGAWSVLMDTGSVEAGAVERVVSFSPEQFVSVNGRTIETFPVKGTIGRDADPVRDAANAKRLLSSAKDLAELHMIVDLMRNDFNRICELGSVTVPVHQELRSHANVHHLHATVRGTLRRDTTLAGLIGAGCPAGSITGAPKTEVMRAIARLEGRKRGFHMGHAFHWRVDGGFDSSVLIRTLTRSRFPGTDVRYELATGSGIVVHSDPEAELAEIEVKARVATARLRQLDSRG